MRRITFALSAIVLTLGSAAAGDQPQWQSAAIARTCEAMMPAYCPARYGFAVDSSGHFSAGPNASGKVIKGSLTADEAALIQADVNAALSAAPGTPGACEQSRASFPGSGNSLTLTLADSSTRSYAISKSGAPGSCNPAGSGKLFSDLDRLAAKYSPVPF